jgi:hypothetical protein
MSPDDTGMYPYNTAPPIGDIVKSALTLTHFEHRMIR